MTLLWSGHGETGADLRKWGRLRGAGYGGGERRGPAGIGHEAGTARAPLSTRGRRGPGFSPRSQGRVRQQGQEAGEIQEVMDPAHTRRQSQTHVCLHTRASLPGGRPEAANSSSSLPAGAPGHSRDCLIVGRQEAISLHRLAAQKRKEVRKRKGGGRGGRGGRGEGGEQEARDKDMLRTRDTRDPAHSAQSRCR